MNGDNVFIRSVEPAVTAVEEADAALAVEAASAEVAATTGVIETELAACVTGIGAKPGGPSSTLVTAGCCVFPEDVFHACALLRPSAEGEYQLSEAVGRLVRAGYSVETVRLSERVNVNTPADKERASELVREEKANGGC